MTFLMNADTGQGAFTITPSDSANLEAPVRAVYVGVTGNLKVTCLDGSVADFPNVPVGLLTIGAVRVWSTGTTATSLRGVK